MPPLAAAPARTKDQEETSAAADCADPLRSTLPFLGRAWLGVRLRACGPLAPPLAWSTRRAPARGSPRGGTVTASNSPGRGLEQAPGACAGACGGREGDGPRGCGHGQVGVLALRPPLSFPGRPCRPGRPRKRPRGSNGVKAPAHDGAHDTAHRAHVVFKAYLGHPLDGGGAREDQRSERRPPLTAQGRGGSRHAPGLRSGAKARIYGQTPAFQRIRAVPLAILAARHGQRELLIALSRSGAVTLAFDRRESVPARSTDLAECSTAFCRGGAPPAAGETARRAVGARGGTKLEEHNPDQPGWRSTPRSAR
jgi:hypothetical protein